MNNNNLPAIGIFAALLAVLFMNNQTPGPSSMAAGYAAKPSADCGCSR